MRTRNCIYCGSGLIQSCTQAHWRLCPTCSPAFVAGEKRIVQDWTAFNYGPLKFRGRPYRDGKPV